MPFHAALVARPRDRAPTFAAVDDFLRTANRRIVAAGDVCTEQKFPRIESAAARIVVANALLRGRRKLSAEAAPTCTFTDPEIAHVGMYVTEARRKNIPVKTFTILMHEVDRAIAGGEEDGLVKLHVREGTGRPSARRSSRGTRGTSSTRSRSR